MVKFQSMSSEPHRRRLLTAWRVALSVRSVLLRGQWCALNALFGVFKFDLSRSQLLHFFWVFESLYTCMLCSGFCVCVSCFVVINYYSFPCFCSSSEHQISCVVEIWTQLWIGQWKRYVVVVVLKKDSLLQPYGPSLKPHPLFHPPISISLLLSKEPFGQTSSAFRLSDLNHTLVWSWRMLRTSI